MLQSKCLAIARLTWSKKPHSLAPLAAVRVSVMDGVTYRQPTRLSAYDYINNLFDWVEAQVRM